VIRSNHRQIDMRVRGGVAMSREVFRGGEGRRFPSCTPRINSVTNSENLFPGFLQTNRVLMIGFPGLLFTSASGA